MKVLIISSRARIISKYSCLSTVVIFENQIKNTVARVHLTWSLQRSPVKSRLSRVPWLRTPRALSTGASYTGALLAALSVGSSAGCTRRTALALLWCRCRPGRRFFLLSAGGYRQISTVTRFQAHPSGLLHWSRGPSSRAAGGPLLTGAILKARSAGGVPVSLLGRSVVKPKLFGAGLSFVSSPALLHKLQVISKFPFFAEHDCLQSMPSEAPETID